MASSALPDWREAAHYHWLLGEGRSAWAWEWLRRDSHYRREALRALASRPAEAALVAEPAAEPWGLHRFEDPDLDARSARPMWTALAWPGTLRLEAAPAADGLDIKELGRASFITGASEHWLECSDGVALRLDVVRGTLTLGAVRPLLDLQGPREILSALAPLKQLAALWSGRPIPREGGLSRARAGRLVRLLRAADALAAGATQRAIAEAILAKDVRGQRWRIEHGSVRLQAQRLVRNARAMGKGGYRGLLSGES